MSTVFRPGTLGAAAAPKHRHTIAFRPGWDTLVALATLIAFWLCYWMASRPGRGWLLYLGILAVGTLVPAATVWWWRGEGLAGLGIRRRGLLVSLVVSALLGLASAYRIVHLAGAAHVDPVAHLLANALVFWEPFFVFGWLFLRWERAFGWLPAIVLTAVGFMLQHIGAVPVAQASFFGIVAGVFALFFAATRNLAILWPLFYPIASAIGTIQAGFVMGWGDVAANAALLAAQAVILVAAYVASRRRAQAERAPSGDVAK